MTRVLLTGDWHVGHKYGAACPEECVNDTQRFGMQFVEQAILKLAPIDIMVNNADAIDGNGIRNGGVELWETDRIKQAKAAIRFKQWIDKLNSKPTVYYATYGTPYHSGNAEQFEEIVADAFPLASGQKNISETLILDVEGFKMQFRHHMSGGSVFTRGNAITRDAAIRIMKEVIGYEKVNLLGRSHVHYHHRNTDFLGKVLQVIPALQMWSSYGEKLCNGITSFGVVAIDIHEGRIVKWHDYYTNNPIVTEKVLRYDTELAV